MPNVRRVPDSAASALRAARAVSVARPSAGLTAGAHATPRLARIGLLALADLVSLVTATAAAYLLWALPVRGQSPALYLPLAPLAVLFLLGYAGAGLYPGFGLGPVETLRRLSYVTASGFVVIAAFSFAFKLPAVYSRMTFAIASASSLILVPLGRAAIASVGSRSSWWPEPVVVIGTGAPAAQAIRSLQRAAHLGYRPVAVLAPSAQAPVPREIEGVPVAGGLEEAPRLAARGIRIVLLETGEAEPYASVDRLQRQFRHVVLLRQLDDLPVEGLRVRNLGAIAGIELTSNLLVPANRAMKRAIDLSLGSCLLILAAPVIACATLLVNLADRGPAFHVQDRAGLDGRRIGVPKIRTMRTDAERRLEEYLAANPDLRGEWGSRYKLRADPRLIPAVGHLLRRFSLDELPQLWSVLRGDMSLVGPRPFPDYHTRQFSPAFLDLRQRVRPGITGLWQVMVRSEGTIDEQEAYDSYYIRNWSVWLDLYILARTSISVVTGRGAY